MSNMPRFSGEGLRYFRRFWVDERKWIPYVLVAPFLVTFLVFTAYPILRATIMSFQEMKGFTNRWTWVGLTHFRSLLVDPQVFIAFRNAVAYAAGSLITQLPVALLMAFLLTAKRLRGQRLFRTLFFLPALMPGVTIGVLGAWLFNDTRGFANALYAALGGAQPIRWSYSPTYILPMFLTVAFLRYTGFHGTYLIAGLFGINEELIEAAVVDGAGFWQRLWYIVLPLLKPVLTYLCVVVTAGSIVMYEIPVLILVRDSMDSLGGAGGQGWFPIPYISRLAFSQFRMGYAAAVGWIVFLFTALLTYIQLKLLRFGETGN